MDTVKHRIFQHLRLSPVQPAVERVALQRLTTLAVHGKRCKRCNGTGLYNAKTDPNANCFACKGQGATGYALTKKALERLDELDEAGVLAAHRSRWELSIILREAPIALEARIEATGITGSYVQYNAHTKPHGTWDRDIYELHQEMRSAAQTSKCFLPVAEFMTLTPIDQRSARDNLLRRIAAAHDRIESLGLAFSDYSLSHTRPDFRRICLQTVGLLPEQNPSQAY